MKLIYECSLPQITKGREQLEEARRTYEILNTELHDELPALHDSRILFLVTNLQTLFASEQVFHCETSKVSVQGFDLFNEYCVAILTCYALDFAALCRTGSGRRQIGIGLAAWIVYNQENQW